MLAAEMTRPGGVAEHLLLRVHRHPEGQDAGAVRHPGRRRACRAPFHLYTMQQAIEEGYILDVLRNYTPYNIAFKIGRRRSKPNRAIEAVDSSSTSPRPPRG